MSDLSFEECLKKGEEGEKYIAENVYKLGFKILIVGGRQLFEITGNKFGVTDLLGFANGKSFWIQAKHCEPRVCYPDTGMPLGKYYGLILQQKQSGIPVLVLFTDSTKKIYGEWLNNLHNCESPYGGTYNSKTGQETIYWLTDKLKDYRELLK